MMTNVMVKTCLNQKIIKNSNLIQAMKNSLFPTANFTRRPIFSESRIFRSLRNVDSTHEMIIVKWHLLNVTLSAKKDILKNFLCVWWWQMLWWKHVLTKKLYKFRIWFRQWRVAYVRKRKLCEGRNFPKAEFVRIFTECSEVWIEHTTW